MGKERREIHQFQVKAEKAYKEFIRAYGKFDPDREPEADSKNAKSALANLMKTHKTIMLQIAVAMWQDLKAKNRKARKERKRAKAAGRARLLWGGPEQSEEFYNRNRNELWKCECLENLGNLKWKFKCEDGHVYIENLGIALNKEFAAKLKAGSTFIIFKLIVECSADLVE